MKFDAKSLIPEFDRFLFAESLHFSGIAVGGAALSILGIIERGTRDLDLLTDPIPRPILNAAKAFARANSLDDTWLNSAPFELVKHLPKDWMLQRQPLYKGNALELSTLSREHLIFVKFWAMCDRDRDFDDLIMLKPSKEELKAAVAWTKPLDGNEHWERHVEEMAKKLSRA